MTTNQIGEYTIGNRLELVQREKEDCCCDGDKVERKWTATDF